MAGFQVVIGKQSLPLKDDKSGVGVFQGLLKAKKDKRGSEKQNLSEEVEHSEERKHKNKRRRAK
jgi:hypothetical protein